MITYAYEVALNLFGEFFHQGLPLTAGGYPTFQVGCPARLHCHEQFPLPRSEWIRMPALLSEDDLCGMQNSA